MKTKRFGAALAATAAVFALTACNSGNDAPDVEEGPGDQQSSAPAEPTEPAEETTDPVAPPTTDPGGDMTTDPVAPPTTEPGDDMTTDPGDTETSPGGESTESVSVPQSEVESETLSKVQSREPDVTAVKCPGDLKGEEGATMTCDVEGSDTLKTVDLEVTSVIGTSVFYDIKAGQ